MITLALNATFIFSSRRDAVLVATSPRRIAMSHRSLQGGNNCHSLSSGGSSQSAMVFYSYSSLNWSAADLLWLDREGNDGPWSSFSLRVGSPSQDITVLVSTASNQPLVVLPEGCPTGSASTCGSDRGGLFEPSSSSTWYITKLHQGPLSNSLTNCRVQSTANMSNAMPRPDASTQTRIPL